MTEYDIEISLTVDVHHTVKVPMTIVAPDRATAHKIGREKVLQILKNMR